MNMMMKSLLQVALLTSTATVHAQIKENCDNYPTLRPPIFDPSTTNITMGMMDPSSMVNLTQNCNDFCLPNTANFTDYIRIDKNTKDVFRNINCNCTANTIEEEFRCTSKYLVFNIKDNYTKDCVEQDINSTGMCEDYCATYINPWGFETSTKPKDGGAKFCNCGVDLSRCKPPFQYGDSCPRVTICGKSAGTVGTTLLGSTITVATTVIGLAFMML